MKTRFLLALLLVLTAHMVRAATDASALPPDSPFQTPLSLADLDLAAFAQWVDGTQAPMPQNDGPRHVIWTRDSHPEWDGVHFGDSKQPGARHLRLGWKTPFAVGAILARGGGSVSVLKPAAAYPGNMANEADWIPATRLKDGKVSHDEAGQEDYAVWVLPPNTSTRAIRFTHVAQATDNSYAGWLGGAWILPARATDVASQGLAIAGTRDEIAFKLNNASNDGIWSAWDNGSEGAAQVISPEHPENITLFWPVPVSLRGLATLWAGFGSADVQIYTGPANRLAREAGEADWKTIKSFSNLQNGYPSGLWPNWLDFGETISTRGVRLRLTSVTQESHPHLNGNTKGGKRVWLGELLALQPLANADIRTALLPVAPATTAPHAPIPIRFSLPEPGLVTLVIEDDKGKRVRNLVSETPFPAGQNVAWWDGTDDLGRDNEAAHHGIYHIPAAFVAPGTYHVRGLWHKPIDLHYEFSVYNAGHPAWETQDGTGGWLTNHTPPQATLFVPGADAPGGKPLVFIGSYVSEGGSGLAWVDLDGRKQGGRGWIGGNWTAAPFLARDSGARRVPGLYAYVGSAFEGELRLTGLSQDGDKAILNPAWKFPGATDDERKANSVLGGIAAHDGLVVMSLPKQNEVLFVDAALHKAIGSLTMPDVRGLAFDAAGRLLLLSGTRLLRLEVPQSLSASRRLDPANWTASASAHSEDAGKAIDADPASRWSTIGAQVPGQTFTLDMKAPQTFSTLVLESSAAQDSPHNYEVWVSNDGQDWGTPITKGEGTPTVTSIAFPRVTARYLKIVQQGTASDVWWSINTLEVRDAPALSTAPQDAAGAETVVANLEDPQGITLDATGNIYVSDRGNSHQVKVFSPDGKLLRAIGHPGAPKAGPYDVLHMNNPHGLAIDANNRLWVAENDFQPKRVSVWTPDGKLWKAFYGPSRYGGGGTLDGRDPSRFYYDGMEFKLDWKTGENHPINIFHRPGSNDLATPDGFAGGSPETPLYAGGRQYLTNCYNSSPTNGASIALLWRLDKDGVARPVAAMGQANDWSVFHGLAPRKDNFSVRWTGTVTPQFSETYTFTTSTDDGARLWVNGQQLVDHWDNPGEASGTVALQVGKRYDLKMEMNQGSGGANAKLEWQSQSQPRQVVPTTALHPAMDAPDASTGLKADYFADTNLQALQASRIDPTINMDFAAGIPADPKKADLAARLPAGADPDRSAWDNSVFFQWQDRNGDNQMQPSEVAFRKVEGGAADGVTVMPDLSFVVTNLGGQTENFKPQRFDAKGVPFYAAKGTVLVTSVQHPTSSGGGQALAGPDGWTVLTVAPQPFAPQSMGGARNGVASWSYPSLWPGLHAGHEAPAPDRPGELIATTRLLGGFVTPNADAGPLWGINGNMGNMYLFTTDGLFVSQLFQDIRQGKSWVMPLAQRDMKLNEVSLHDENFWPSISQTPDGKIYVVDGGRSSLVRVDGLDSIRRLAATPLRVSVDDLKRAQTFLVQEAALRQSAQGQGTLHVARRDAAPVIDGKLDEWNDANWATIDKSGVAAYFNSNSKPYDVSAALATSNDRLYAAFRTGDAELLKNSGETPNAPFKTGGALDLMIGADPTADPKRATSVAGDERLLVTQVKGKTLALLYRAVVPGTQTPVPFSSPWRTITIDRVDDISNQVQLAGDGQGNYEVSVPLAALGLKPQPGGNIKGDVGILRGNGFQTLQRVYWSNKATAIVSDVPSEAMLMPQLWGRWEW